MDWRHKLMTENEYEIWWQLHLRVATGEALAAEEERRYRAGLELLEREEAAQLSSADVTLLRSLRARLQTLVQLQNKLLSQSAKLDQKIEELERTYQQLTGLDLAVDVYATR
jgi:hypothetical protein